MRKNIYDLIGERVREERKMAGLTIEKLADALRIPVSRLFEDMSGPQKDAIYAATQKFAQIIRSRNTNETAAIIEIAKTAALHMSGNKSK